LVLLTAVVLVSWLGQKDTRALFGGAWALIFLLPVLNAGTFTDVLVAERFLYLPSAGFCWILSAGYERIRRRASSRWALRVVATTLILLAGLRTWYRNPVWSDELTLFDHMFQSSPHYPLPRILLAEAYQRAGDAERALRGYEEALKQEPENCKLLNAMAVAQLELGVSRRSGPILDRGFDFLQSALDICPQDDFLHHTLGEYYLRQGNLEAALREFRTAVTLNPYKVSYYHNIGALLFASGKRDEARPFLQEYVARGPRGIYRDQALEWLNTIPRR
jgi:tetratricopeptide (TPR) repeat protein